MKLPPDGSEIALPSLTLRIHGLVITDYKVCDYSCDAGRMLCVKCVRSSVIENERFFHKTYKYIYIYLHTS